MNFYAGVDGGGTKTAVLCVNEQGKSVASAGFGPFNINSVGRDGLRAVMLKILAFLQEQGTCLGLCIGAAGNGNAALREEVAAAMAAAPEIPFSLVGDYEIARYGALGGKPGLALVAGTGSVCSGVNAAGQKLRVGGWGHLIGDGGSGYALGRDALRQLTLSRDGMAERGQLCELLERDFGLITREKIVERAYSMDKSATAALAGCVLTAADGGDPAATGILEKNARELAQLSAAVAKGLGMEAPELALLGGLIRDNNCYHRRVVAALEAALPGVRCVECAYAPDRGAALMAKAGGERSHG